MQAKTDTLDPVAGQKTLILGGHDFHSITEVVSGVLERPTPIGWWAIFGAADPKGGAVLHGPRLFGQPTCHHAPEVYSGIGESEAGEMLRAFFRDKRGRGAEILP